MAEILLPCTCGAHHDDPRCPRHASISEAQLQAGRVVDSAFRFSTGTIPASHVVDHIVTELTKAGYLPGEENTRLRNTLNHLRTALPDQQKQNNSFVMRVECPNCEHRITIKIDNQVIATAVGSDGPHE